MENKDGFFEKSGYKNVCEKLLYLCTEKGSVENKTGWH